MPDVAMPRLSDSMEEGTILKWLKADGDEVETGDELVEIETDKANMTYEAEAGGVLEIVAKEGSTLPVGEVIARVGAGAEAGGGGDREVGGQEEGGEGGEHPAAEPAAAGQPDEAGQPDATEQPDEAEQAQGEERGDTGANGAGDGNRVKASPVARRMAREMGVELETVTGTGPGGRIVKSDIESLATDAEAPAAAGEPAEATEARPSPAPAAAAGDGGTAKGNVTHEELSRLQQVVARRMAESKATAPEFVMSLDVEMDAAIAVRQELKRLAAEGQAVPSFNDFVVKACATALREFPRANGAYRDGRFELYSRVNVGVAVAAQDALVVPTVFDADRKSLGQIAADVRSLAEKVRAGKVTPPELSGGTFTVSNLGMYGIKRFTAVINPPQAAILAVGAMEPRPVVRDERVVVRTMLDLTLAGDHRILYGADAAQFLGRIRQLLEQPLRLAL